MKCVALVTAGGQGIRMGTAMPKQFLELDGLPVLARTLMVFETHPLIQQIVVTVPLGDEDPVRSEIVQRLKMQKVNRVLAGGPTRRESVYNGLMAVGEAEIVAIHDGVRPLVSPDVISATIETAWSTGAAAACVRVRETVKRQVGSYLETVPRSGLWLAHTPQTFRTDLIIEAHRRAIDDGYEGTDDASLVERMGHPVSIVEDSEYNLKITTPDDLELARFLLKSALLRR